MNQQLRYGGGATLDLEMAPERLLADCTRPRGEPLDDPVAAVAAALTDPLEFPPLRRAVVPGDQVVLALDAEVPCADAVVAGVVHTLLEAGVQGGDITLLCAGDPTVRRDPRALLSDELREAVSVAVHDPADEDSLSYLAASKDAEPIYFNRTINDADVVIPISCLRLENSLGYLGVPGGLFPTFADQRSQKRLRAWSPQDWQAHRRARSAEASEAAWLLGVQFTVQVVPGPGESLLHILAGDVQHVAARGRELCEAAWQYEVPRRASLVVATIEGGQQQQTWDNVARALVAATQVVSDEGAIVLCTELRERPGPALRWLATAEPDAHWHRQLRRQRMPDALPASVLAEVLDHARVYLLSGLDSDFVEELGLGHVERPEQIERLSRQHESCILVANAQHAVVRAREN